MTREQRAAFEAVATPQVSPQEEHIAIVRARLERWGALGITAEVAIQHQVALDDLIDPENDKHAVQARHAAWKRLFRSHFFSTTQIASLFGVHNNTVREAVMGVRDAQSAA